jgi:hypothetical protein
MAKKKARRKASSRKKSSSRKPVRKKSAKRKSRRKYGAKASQTVERAMHKRKHGTLRSGKGGKGGKVKSRKQAIAIGLSEARAKGAKVPEKKS